MNKIAEEIFDTAVNPEQIPINDESRKKLDALTPYWLTYKLEGGEPISWVIVIPTTKDLMTKFLAKEITEKELMNLTRQGSIFDALYLCSAITVPEHRGQGLAISLLKEAINNFHLGEGFALFAWPTTEDGFKIVNRLEADLNKKILIRN